MTDTWQDNHIPQDALPGMPEREPTDDAPFGINPRTGEPYKRDPATWAHLAAAREKAAAARREAGKRTGKAPTKKAGKSAPEERTHGDRIAALIKIGSAVIETRSPLDAAIARQSADRLGPIIDRLCEEDQRVADFLDGIMRWFGPAGAWSELATEAIMTGGAFALAHGVTHPILQGLAGGILVSAAADAAASYAARTQEPIDPMEFLPAHMRVALGIDEPAD